MADPNAAAQDAAKKAKAAAASEGNPVFKMMGPSHYSLDILPQSHHC